MSSTKNVYRSNLFDKLTSDISLSNALAELDALQTYHSYHAILDQLLCSESQMILVLAISRLQEHVTYWILHGFPLEIADYNISIYPRLLASLSTSILFHLADNDPKFLGYHHSIQAAGRAIPELASFSAVDVGRPVDTSPFLRRKNSVSQKQTKKARQIASLAGALPAVEPNDYAAMGVIAPKTHHDIPHLTQVILNSQKDILEVYIDFLCNTEIFNRLREQFFTDSIQPEVTTDVESSEEMKLQEEQTGYTSVLHMKAVLHFDSPVDWGAWKIVIGGAAGSFLRTTHKRSPTTFDIVVKKMKDLSNGHFSDDNHKRLNGSNTAVPIYEAKITRDLRLVYQVDLVPVEHHREQQAVKIFDICTHAQMDKRLWSTISSQLGKKGREYQERCSIRKSSHPTDKDIFVPQTFPPLAEVTLSKLCNFPDLLPNDTAQVHARLVVEKFVTFSQASPYLNTILADLDVTLPHLVSSREKDIIENQNSCYVIGRSGTGKTTTMLFKMLLIERTHHLYSSDLPRPRQLFVTKSRVLAGKVQEYFSKLSMSLDHASRPLSELKTLPKVDNYCDEDGDDVYNFDDLQDTAWRPDLPMRFSYLEDRHFPLFISYDGLCNMLEADIAAVDKEAPCGKGKLIDFEMFKAEYWAHFSQKTRKGLDAVAAFSEIVGVIKGSEETLREEKRHLSKDAYARWQHPHAEQMYSLFQSYTAKKKLSGDYDVADRTHTILKFFEAHGILGQGVDHLYIDEVQDNLLIDTMVLRLLSKNSNGHFWAGDTAQTISAGSSFRFNELKAFQHRLESRRRSKPRSMSIIQVEDPKTFQLAVNYRSHAGIVDCAHSIIELIDLFWPDSIDRLAPEVGLVDGFKPVFFGDEDHEQLKHFIFGGLGSHVEFGAHQCVLVRNEEAKRKLLSQVGEIGVVLTIYESKGLEFNDVLLYDFFHDSAVRASTWRVVLNAISDWDSAGGQVAVPSFDDTRHASVCTELKSLYVAITRARENVWIVDGSDAGRFMKTFWSSRGLINIFVTGSEPPHLATSSSLKDWSKQGRTLFDQKQFAAARHCFNRGKEPKRAAVANAYSLQQEARVIGTTRHTLERRRNTFKKAGEAFLSCASTSKHSQIFLRNAASCFEEANDLHRAATTYRAAEEFNRAGELFRNLKKFDDAVAVVNIAQDKMEPNIVDSILTRARIAYFSSQEIKKGCELFKTTEAAMDYMEQNGWDLARADIFVTLGQTVEAGELHYSEGHHEVAIELFMTDETNAGGMHRGLECILEVLRKCCSFGRPLEALRADPLVNRVVELSRRFATVDFGFPELAELQVFYTLMDESSDLLALGMQLLDGGHPSSALLCLDQAFTGGLGIADIPLAHVVDVLAKFNSYVVMLSHLAFHTDPCADVFTSRLFGFSMDGPNSVIVSSPTWLHAHIASSRELASEFEVPVAELRSHFRTALTYRLRERTQLASEACAYSRAFLPCLSYVAFETCPRVQCPENHITAREIDSEYYHQRVRAHVQQILILQSLRESQDEGADADEDGDGERALLKRHGPKFWLLRLYDALYPSHHGLGSIADLDIISSTR